MSEQDPSIEEMKAMMDGAPTPEKKEEPPASPQETPPVDETPKADSGTAEKKFAPKEKSEGPKGYQDRINKLVWKNHEAERQAEKAKREADELRQKLSALETQAPGKPEPKPATSFSDAEPQLVEHDPDKYETYQEYLKAQAVANAQYAKDMTAWQFRKDRAEFSAQEAERQAQTAKQSEATATEQRVQEAKVKWVDTYAKAVAVNPNIADAVIGPAGKFFDDIGLSERIMRSELGPEVILYAQEHPEDTLAVARTGDVNVVREYIAKIEGQLELQKKFSLTTESKTLPPPVSISGGSAPVASTVDLSDKNLSIDEWIKEARRQLS